MRARSALTSCLAVIIEGYIEGMAPDEIWLGLVAVNVCTDFCGVNAILLEVLWCESVSVTISQFGFSALNCEILIRQALLSWNASDNFKSFGWITTYE